MGKDTAMDWIGAFETLPQCVRLRSYEPGVNPFDGAEHAAVINALTGAVIVAVCESRQTNATPAVWRMGMSMPVLAYPHGESLHRTKAISLLSEVELEQVLAIWRMQTEAVTSRASGSSAAQAPVPSDAAAEPMVQELRVRSWHLQDYILFNRADGTAWQGRPGPSPAWLAVDGNPIQVLRAAADGRLKHLYAGKCPDSVEGPDVRDDACVVCQALVALSPAKIEVS